MKKHISGILSVIYTFLEFSAFLIWGMFGLMPGDEMGFGLIVIYGAMPLSALILCLLLSAKKSPFLIPVAVLKILSHIFLPFLIYGSFEIGISLILSAIPCAIGFIIGFIIRKIKSK